MIVELRRTIELTLKHGIKIDRNHVVVQIGVKTM